jgi:hypothetical protein
VSVQRHFRTKFGTDPEAVERVRARFRKEPSEIGRAAAGDQELLRWPPRSPDLTPCDFFLWGFIKDRVFVPPLPTMLVDLSTRITVIDHDVLQRVWQELCVVLRVEHMLNICNVPGEKIDEFSFTLILILFTCVILNPSNKLLKS